MSNFLKTRDPRVDTAAYWEARIHFLSGPEMEVDYKEHILLSGAEALGGVLERDTKLRVLEVNGNALGVEGVAPLAAAIGLSPEQIYEVTSCWGEDS
jgi:hypothetical protein